MIHVKQQSSLPEINPRYEDLRIDMSKERYDPYSDLPAPQISGYSKNVQDSIRKLRYMIS